MAKSRSNLPSLVKKLSNAKGTGSAMGGAASPINQATKSENLASTSTPAISRIGDTRSLGLNAGTTSGRGTRFGGGSTKASTKTSQPGSEWRDLLNQTVSGGLASILSNPVSAFGGIGPIISGIEKLFGGGGKAAPPALVHFQLPASQEQVAYSSGSHGSSHLSTTSTQTSSSLLSGTYHGGNLSNTSAFQSQSTLIVEAVKQALLNSSALNDVIAEI